MLIGSSVISSKQLSQIKATSIEIGMSKLETAFELNFVDENKILKLLSNDYSLPIVDLDTTVIDPKIKKIIDPRYIQDNFLVPFSMGNGILKIAIADSSKLSLMKNLKTMTKMEPELYATSISGMNNFIERFIKNDSQKILDTKVKVAKIENKDELIEVGSEVIVFGNKLITEAINLGASDIHIESFRDASQARFRVDGILKVMDKYSKFLHENYDAIIARVKIISIS